MQSLGPILKTLSRRWADGKPRQKPGSANPLDDLAVKHGTDKGTRSAGDLSAKAYTIPYFRCLEAIRTEPLVLLEIGVKRGSSLRMWEEFLPNAKILGIDIDPKCRKQATARSQVFIGDQSDPALLQSVIEAAGGSFDAVIDDGSHRMEHHQASLAFLWPHLRDGGWYAIEDLHTCYGPEYGGGHLAPDSTMERVIKPLLDTLNMPRSRPIPFVPGVESVHVYRSIAFLFKARAA